MVRHSMHEKSSIGFSVDTRRHYSVADGQLGSHGDCLRC